MTTTVIQHPPLLTLASAGLSGSLLLAGGGKKKSRDVIRDVSGHTLLLYRVDWAGYHWAQSSIWFSSKNNSGCKRLDGVSQ